MELVPLVIMFGREFPEYSYKGTPPRVGDTVSVTKEYAEGFYTEAVVQRVTWKHHVFADGDQCATVTVRLGAKKPNEPQSILGGIVDRFKKKETDKKPCFVYFIANETAGMVKIGHSSDPVARCANLQTSNHTRLKLLFAMPGTEALEAWLHQKFDAYRAEGEWFRLEGALESYINLMTQEA